MSWTIAIYILINGLVGFLNEKKGFLGEVFVFSSESFD
jgi:hypothetical protein